MSEDAELVESLTKQCVKELNDQRKPSRRDIYLPWGGIFEKRKPEAFPTEKGEA
jgi:hypothetical protein